MWWLAEQLDSAMLIYSTFFLGDVHSKADRGVNTSNTFQPRPSMLWMYFSSKKMRSLYYAGFAAKVAYDCFQEGDWLYQDLILIGLFTITSYLNFPFRTTKASNTGIGFWKTVASDNTGVNGSWWFGGGDGDWFGFIGHNGSSETMIIPASLLEQMSLNRGQMDNHGTQIFEENDDGFENL